MEHAPRIPLYDDNMPSGVSTILTNPGENVAPADPSKSRIMLVDGTSVMYRSYYKILGQWSPYALMYWYITFQGVSWCSVPEAHLIVYALRFIDLSLASANLGMSLGMLSHVHLPCYHNK